MAVTLFDKLSLWRSYLHKAGVIYSYATPTTHRELAAGGSTPTTHGNSTALNLASLSLTGATADPTTIEHLTDEGRDALREAGGIPVNEIQIRNVNFDDDDRDLLSLTLPRILVLDGSVGLDQFPNIIPSTVEHLYLRSCDRQKTPPGPFATAPSFTWRLQVLDVTDTGLADAQVLAMIRNSSGTLADLFANGTAFSLAAGASRDFLINSCSKLKTLHVNCTKEQAKDFRYSFKQHWDSLLSPAKVERPTIFPHYPRHERQQDEQEVANELCVPNPGGNYSYSWTNKAGVKDVGGSYAYADAVNGLNRYGETKLMYASDFGFSVPTSETITGIKIEAMAKAVQLDLPYLAGLYTSEIGLTKNGTTDFSENHGDFDCVNPWPQYYADQGSGGVSDTWNYSLTPSQANASAFGVYFRVENCCNTKHADPNVEYIRVYIYHSGAGSTAVGLPQAVTEYA